MCICSTSSGIFGIIKTTLSNTLALRTDISWQIVPLYGWAGAEVFINIVCGSLPTLKPLYDRIIHKKPLYNNSRQYEHYNTGQSTEKSDSGIKKNIFYGQNNDDYDAASAGIIQPGTGSDHDLERFVHHTMANTETYGHPYHLHGEGRV